MRTSGASFSRLLDQFSGLGREHVVIASGQRKADPATRTAQTETVAAIRTSAGTGDFPELGSQLRLKLLLRDGALGPRHQRRQNVAAVNVVAASDRKEVFDGAIVHQRLHDVLNALDLTVRVLQANAIRTDKPDRQPPAILRRQQLFAKFWVCDRGSHNRQAADRNEHDRRAKHAIQNCDICPP